MKASKTGSGATTEDSIKYTWNYALLPSKDPTEESIFYVYFFIKSIIILFSYGLVK